MARDGKPAVAYGPTVDVIDSKAFEERGRNDRHQFRFIVAPEDAIELEGLKGYTRRLMEQMSRDLGTRLEWVAVDHWNTDNPHTHIVLRGKDQFDRDLVIAREYISDGMRMRAAGLATEWLGLKTEHDIRQGLAREVSQERWTGLDRMIQREAKAGSIDLRDARGSEADRQVRALKIGRLQQLVERGLAVETATAVWRVEPNAEATLRAMGERGDIIRTMQRAFTRNQRDLSIVESDKLLAPITGRIASKGLSDELYDRMYVVIDGVDGKGHYVSLPAKVDASELPIGGIVTIKSNVESRAADDAISKLATDGIYRTEDHRKIVHGNRSKEELEVFIQSHERRLEALRRSGIVERIESGVWRVPNDLVTRGQDYDRRKSGGVTVELASHLTIEKQVRAIGSTWLDQQLVSGSQEVVDIGFGAETRQARQQRMSFLIEEGFAERQGASVKLHPNLLARLREREVSEIGAALAADRGLEFKPVNRGQRVAGVYKKSLQLNSGKFAMLDDGAGLTLVPWRPIMDRKLGQQITGVVHAAGISWDIGKQRGPTIG